MDWVIDLGARRRLVVSAGRDPSGSDRAECRPEAGRPRLTGAEPDEARARSNSDRVLDEDHGRPAGSELALEDQGPRPRRMDAQHFEQPSVLIWKYVFLNPLKCSVQVRHNLLAADHQD